MPQTRVRAKPRPAASSWRSDPLRRRAVACAPIFECGEPEAARGTDLGRFAGWHEAERLAGNLHRAYSEIKGEPLGAPLDPRPMIADMIAYNGGKPVRCLA
jgi:hypothetical protein